MRDSEKCADSAAHFVQIAQTDKLRATDIQIITLYGKGISIDQIYSTLYYAECPVIK